VMLVAVACAAVALGAQRGQTQTPSPGTIDETIPPGANYDKAEFRLWVPKQSDRLQAVAVLVPGSNGDGRGQVDDPVWQEFATKHHLALVGCRFTDKPHDLNFI